MNVKILAVVIVFFTNFRLCQGIRYDNFIMYRTVPWHQDQLNFLINLEKQNYIEVKFWQRPYKLYQSVQLMVKPKDVPEFLERVNHFGLRVEEMNTDVQGYMGIGKFRKKTDIVLPYDLRGYNKRIMKNNEIRTVPKTRLTKVQKQGRYLKVLMYNKLPKGLTALRDSLFKQKLKIIFFENNPFYKIEEYISMQLIESLVLGQVQEITVFLSIIINLVLVPVGILFDRQKTDTLRYNKRITQSYIWDAFHSPLDIEQWLNDIQLKYPKFCKLISIGKSAENRNIYALSIFRGSSKGTAIMEGGIHGNEWISTEFVMYFANSLVRTNSESESRLATVANNYQWFLIPVANPDGFEYNHIVDRMWRKNRRRIANNTFGVDLNRNFRYSFGKFGTSNILTNDMYCGPEPFSEPETLALSKFVTKNAKDLKFYFSIHSYGQQIMIPYGDTILHVDNYAECENLANQALHKMYRLHGKKYRVGNSYDLRGHKISGNSASWVKKTFKVPYVFTFLLRDTGTYGYGIPPQEILPTCEEVQTGVLEIMTTTVRRFRTDDVYSDMLSRVKRTRVCNGLVYSAVIIWLAK